MGVIQISQTNWITGIANRVASLAVSPEQLTASHGFQFSQDKEEALGDIDVALFIAPCGQLFGLVRYRGMILPNSVTIFVDYNLEDPTYLINEIMGEMGWKTNDVIRFDLRYYRFNPCTLFREDDHGTPVAVSSHDAYPDAVYEKMQFEKKSHKQFYFIKMDRPKPQGWTGNWIDTERSRAEEAYNAKGIVPPWNNLKK